MPKIIFLEDAEYRLQSLLLPTLVEYTRNNFGDRRRWNYRHCRNQVPAACVREIRGWLATEDWHDPLILSIDSQLGPTDYEKLLGVTVVYADLLRNPGIRWLGIAIISEHVANLHPEIRNQLQNEVLRVEAAVGYRPENRFWGTATGTKSAEEFAVWANGLATQHGVEL